MRVRCVCMKGAKGSETRRKMWGCAAARRGSKREATAGTVASRKPVRTSLRDSRAAGERNSEGRIGCRAIRPPSSSRRRASFVGSETLLSWCPRAYNVDRARGRHRSPRDKSAASAFVELPVHRHGHAGDVDDGAALSHPDRRAARRRGRVGHTRPAALLVHRGPSAVGGAERRQRQGSRELGGCADVLEPARGRAGLVGGHSWRSCPRHQVRGSSASDLTAAGKWSCRSASHACTPFSSAVSAASAART